MSRPSCNKTLKLFVAGFDGFVLVYEINLTEGGECKQTNQYQLFNLSQIRADASTSASNVTGLVSHRHLLFSA